MVGMCTLPAIGTSATSYKYPVVLVLHVPRAGVLHMENHRSQHVPISRVNRLSNFTSYLREILNMDTRAIIHVDDTWLNHVMNACQKSCVQHVLRCCNSHVLCTHAKHDYASSLFNRVATSRNSHVLHKTCHVKNTWFTRKCPAGKLQSTRKWLSAVNMIPRYLKLLTQLIGTSFEYVWLTTERLWPTCKQHDFNELNIILCITP